MIKVLVVDDDPSARRALAKYLSSSGFVVEAAENSREAYALASGFAPDALVVDWMLGDSVDGIEVTRELRASIPDVPAIIISGYLDEEIENRIRHHSNIRFLAKPFPPRDLVAEIRKLAL